MKTLLGSSRGSNQDLWYEIFGQQWNTAASQNSSADSKLEARTDGKMGSRYLAGKKMAGKTKRLQFVIKLDAVAVVMVVGIVSEMEAANECNR